MKKFLKTLFIIILFGLLGYLAYSSRVIVPRNNIIILYSKFNGKFKIFKKPFNIVLLKAIPYNTIQKKYPLEARDFQFIFNKKLNLLDKEIDLLKYKILIKYNLIIDQYKYLFDNYDSLENIHNTIKDEFESVFHEKINQAIRNSDNLNIYPEKAEKETSRILAEKLVAKGINIISLRIINIDIIPKMNYSQLSRLINESLEYEENFKLNIRKIELEKIKQIKEAENEVEYLRIIGEYIKENPLILKYMMIKKIDKNDLIFIPSSDIGFDFSNSLKDKAYKKFKKK